MKFKNYLSSIDGISVYPLFTLILFVLIFVLASILIFSKSKQTIEHIKNIPLDDGNV
ncbi:CcoQ/FixQ family Cbb3-type cytochrome c oxidase assembly chaperone [Taibaiella sp. KBW10]|uniref:cbb3-type cytochrome c oxidase subunit 3 n=1 Tax=Taibaiella sp. KBW10 TaxID=2153357 RepID=UPI000F598004|nr:cbb3-type cytochrome c oxidase subunit 3 [Taibaiella sp. KBW10]RQO30068.1 CcoQ/FixQ family Cbb3-type cytochrome c oxidase assembly chaperone [Taibaiella sp. KBW10]